MSKNKEVTPVYQCSDHAVELHVVYGPVSSCLSLKICRVNSLWDRFQRPAWTTGTLIPASFLCGIISAVLIWRGGQHTRRTEKIEQTLRTALAIENKEEHTPLHGSTENISKDYPDPPHRQTSVSGTNDLDESLEKDDDSSAMTASSVVSPAIVDEMTIPPVT